MDLLSVDNIRKIVCRGKVTPQQVIAMELVDEAARNFMAVIGTHVPECEDRRSAFKAVREARMWSNAAISLKGEI